MRQCSKCGYMWPMPRKEPRSGHLFEGIPLGPETQSVAILISQQIASEARDDAEVRQALSHCPQCGSNEFKEYRADRVPGASQKRP